MTIPLHTSLGSVLRRPAQEDPYAPSAEASTLVATGIRAHISAASGNSEIVGGQQSTTTYEMQCDPCDLRHTDQWRDDTNNVLYDVAVVQKRVGLGLDHMHARLTRSEGAA